MTYSCLASTNVTADDFMAHNLTEEEDEEAMDVFTTRGRKKIPNITIRDVTIFKVDVI